MRCQKCQFDESECRCPEKNAYNKLKEKKEEEIARLRKALEEIREFGRVNAGCGYTCAKMAQKALEE